MTQFRTINADSITKESALCGTPKWVVKSAKPNRPIRRAEL